MFSYKNGERGIPCSDKTFLFKEWAAAQIKTELDEVHGDNAPTLKTVYF